MKFNSLWTAMLDVYTLHMYTVILHVAVKSVWIYYATYATHSIIYITGYAALVSDGE